MDDRFKFRAWDGVKMWSDIEDCDTTIWHGIIVPEGDTILMQSTGLKDKNDVLIFEGDVCEIDWFVSGEKWNVKVEWLKWQGGYVLTGLGGWVTLGRMLRDDDDKCTIRVIGNIHQNKELLECQINPNNT